MPLLHIVNKSHLEHGALHACLRLSKRGSGVLLVEDAVYAAQKLPRVNEQLAEAMVERAVYALTPDIRARGIAVASLLSEITLVDYAGFVDLTIEYDSTVSWF